MYDLSLKTAGAIILTGAAAFGMGYFAHQHYSRGSAEPPSTNEAAEDVRLQIQKNDGTIERIVVRSDKVIACTEEDIFGYALREEEERREMKKLQKERFPIYTPR